MSDATDPQVRAAFVDGLRALADFLASHSDVPVPPPRSEVTAYLDGTDDTKNAEVERIARCLDVPLTGRRGLYRAVRSFGPVTYQAIAISKARIAATEALMSYSSTFGHREA
jgi:hypothetical protein